MNELLGLNTWVTSDRHTFVFALQRELDTRKKDRLRSLRNSTRMNGRAVKMSDPPYCGCFRCKGMFPTEEVHEYLLPFHSFISWPDRSGRVTYRGMARNDWTVTCPKCSTDCVVGGYTGVTKAELQDLNWRFRRDILSGWEVREREKQNRAQLEEFVETSQGLTRSEIKSIMAKGDRMIEGKLYSCL